MDKTSTPPIDITKSQYDLSTYWGRIQHFARVTNPLTLLASRQELMKAEALVKDYAAGDRPDLYDKPNKVWDAKYLVESSIHPDTGKPVPLPWRMAAFVPTNLFILAGMLRPNPSVAQTIFWQTANQTLNVCVNYSNATADATMTPKEIGIAYASATSTSVGLAVGLNSIVPRLRSLSPSTRGLLGRFVPFVAVASAGCVNVGLMRWKEIKEGNDIFPPATPEDPNPKSLGKSTRAGFAAVSQTAASRVLCNIPTLIIPPLAMTWLGRRGLFKGPHGRRIEMAAELTIVGSSLLAFLPPAIAWFPQRGTLDVSHLEEKFRDLKDPRTGEPLKQVEFNKGL